MKFYTYKNLEHFPLHFLFLSIKAKAISIFLRCFFFPLGGAEGGRNWVCPAPLLLKFLRTFREAAECRSLVCFGAQLFPDATPPGIVVNSTYLTSFLSFSILFKLWLFYKRNEGEWRRIL